MENLSCNLWKLFLYISNYYHSKRSSRRCFEGNDFHHQVTGFVHVFSCLLFFFFLPSTIFLISPSWRGRFVQKNYAIKNRGHPARSRAKEHCACLHGPFIEKQYRVLGMCALTCLITWFVFAVQDAQCNTEESPLDW